MKKFRFIEGKISFENERVNEDKHNLMKQKFRAWHKEVREMFAIEYNNGRERKRHFQSKRY